MKVRRVLVGAAFCAATALWSSSVYSQTKDEKKPAGGKPAGAQPPAPQTGRGQAHSTHGCETRRQARGGQGRRRQRGRVHDEDDAGNVRAGERARGPQAARRGVHLLDEVLLGPRGSAARGGRNRRATGG